MYTTSIDFLVASDVRACTDVLSTGVAIIPIAYSRKFSSLFECALGYALGVAHRGVPTDLAWAKTLAAVDRRVELAENTKQKQDLAAQRLDRSIDLLFEQISQLEPGR